MMPKEIIFEAESTPARPRSLMAEIYKGVTASKYIAYRLFLKDIKTQYSNALLGQFWNFANPLVMALVFIVLFGDGIIESENISMSYSIYVVFGMSLFQVFTQSVLLPLGLFSRSGVLLKQVRVLPEALVLSQIYQLVFNSIFFVAVLLVISVVFGEFNAFGFACFVCLFPAMILTGLGVGLIFAPLNTIYSDFSLVITNMIRPLMFVCPTFYRSSSENQLLELVNSFNPIGIIMDNLRNLAIHATLNNARSFSLTCGFLVLVFVVGWLFFHRSARVLRERL